MVVYIDGEFRGFAKRKSGKGNEYLLVTGEDQEGTSFQIYSKDLNVSAGFEKGDSCKFLAELDFNAKYPKFELLDIKSL